MSCILYYSNFCDHSKKLLQGLSKTNVSKDVHFICIDKRMKDPSTGKIFIVLENGQKIVMPETVTRVPALLQLNNNYNVLFGESISQYFRPKQENAVMQATMNNLEPMAFSFGDAGYGGIVSDNYSFLDTSPEDMVASGNGGMRQMHNYVDLNYVDKISTPADESDYKTSGKVPQGLTVEQLQQQREQEFQKFNGGNSRPPI